MEAAVRGGSLAPGDRLPSVRSLAGDLGVSPATVAAAYAELRRRGITTGTGRGGTRIRSAPPVSVRGHLRVPEGARDLISGGPDPSLLPALPLVAEPRHARMYADVPVAPRLRSLATELFAADGIDAANLAVASGALDGVERVLASWAPPGGRVVVEDPGHAVTFDLLAAMGYTMVPVPVDRDGIRPGELAAVLERGHADALIVTPRAQAATGAAWSSSRAADLRAVLADFPSVGVIEDDHAGPVAGVPLWSVCEGRDRWVAIRSVSKSLGPDLRLAVLAGDEVTVSRVTGRQALGTGWVSYLLQETVADLWADPAVSGVSGILADAAGVYAARGRALRSALAGHGIAATGCSGFTCWVPVLDEDDAASALAGAGWAVAPGRRFRIASPPGIRICYAALDQAEAAPFAADVARALRHRAPRLD